jgi:hypothetical protein
MTTADLLLKTFVHVSDLHIGQIDPRSGDANVSVPASVVYQSFPWLDGLLGHHGRALRDLQEFCDHLVDQGESFELLVTGDLTRCGDPNEIATVRRFLASTVDLNPPLGNLVGLNLKTMPPASITGNHDNWGGSNHPVGGGPLAARTLVPNDMPFVLRYALPNGRRLLLSGIDTDAQIKPWGMKRVYAIGSFQQQLVALEQLLPSRRPGDIRVLLAHHSMARTSFRLRMDAGSRAALSAFLSNHGFSILLSGHTHHRMFSSLPVSGRNGSSHVEELTCGSTTQHDQVPYSWRNLIGKLPSRRWPDNTLIVHRLYGTPGATRWEAQAYVRTTRGFQSMGVSGAYTIPL